MTIQELRLLFDYHYWARDRILNAVEPLSLDQVTRDMGNSFRSVRDTLAHIYAADWAWYSRWIGNSPTALLPADTFPDIAAIRAAWIELEAQAYGRCWPISTIRASTGSIEYRLLSGQPGSTVFWQMAQHVVNHATYHRGQVTTMLRQLGVEPAKSHGPDRVLSRTTVMKQTLLRGRRAGAGRSRRAGAPSGARDRRVLRPVHRRVDPRQSRTSRSGRATSPARSSRRSSVK